MTASGAYRRLADVVTAKAGNNKTIKGTQSSRPGPGLVQGFSASGPDVWVETADYVRPGVVLSAVGARCGKTFIAEGAWTAIANTHVLLPLSEVDHRWLWYLTNDESFWVRGGSAQPFVKVKDTLQKEVRVPTLLEQRRVVAILDEAFEGIATAKANAEKNLQNAREVFERHLQALFSTPRASWAASTLGATYDVRDGTHDSPKYHDRGHPLITSKNLKRDGLSFDDVKLIEDADYRKFNERSAVHKGDVLFAMIGTIGNPTVVEVEPDFAIKNVALFKVPARQSGHYLRYFLSSQGVVTKMQSEAKGTTQKFVGLGYLRAFPIHVPPEAEQSVLVRELDGLSTETDRLESICAQKMAALDELKNSLLHRAFSGAL